MLCDCVRWVLSEGHGRDGPALCLDDGQTEAQGVVALWTRRGAAPAYAIIPDLTKMCDSTETYLSASLHIERLVLAKLVDH